MSSVHSIRRCQPQPQQQQQPHQHEQPAEQESLPGRRGLKVLQLTGARLAPGPSTPSAGTLQAATTAQATASSNRNHSRSPGSPSTAAGLARRNASCEPTGLQELHLGCQPEQVDSTWLHLNDAVTSQDIIRLLGNHCQVGGDFYFWGLLHVCMYLDARKQVPATRCCAAGDAAGHVCVRVSA